MPKSARILVRVEELDIRAGRRENCEGCPLALAIHRALGYPVYVAGEDVGECTGDPKVLGSRLAVLPARARRFVKDFDAGRKVRPFEFRLSVAPRRPSTS
jgi:hypothetical protein